MEKKKWEEGWRRKRDKKIERNGWSEKIEKRKKREKKLRGEERERYNLFIYFLSFELQWAVMFDRPL